nr:CD8 beta chain isoform s beta4 {alternatively spliced} [human, Peptide Partial, 45 aa] [Homo sapiens]
TQKDFTNKQRIGFWCPATKRHRSVMSTMWKNERRDTFNPGEFNGC